MRFKIALFLFLLFFCFSNAQKIKYVSADSFPLIGKISPNTETRYERLPVDYKSKYRPEVWELGKNSSGLAVLFSSNSTSISAKWESLFDTDLDHMPDVGVKGLDLYTWNGKAWQFVNSGRPKTKKKYEQTIISNMKPENRDFMLFLPLYDGVESLQIGVDSASFIKNPIVKRINTGKPIVVYGTSITQGGCASRPGMSYTNILTRRMNREFINLGFSGNGKLDFEIAEIMSRKENVSLYILDFVPNVNDKDIKEKLSKFISILREKKPNTPILLIETIQYPSSKFDLKMAELLLKKNQALKLEFEKLKKAGDKDIYYLAAENLIGNDFEATVDGIHFTDVGFERFATLLQKKINKIRIN